LMGHFKFFFITPGDSTKANLVKFSTPGEG
jgi:hypothetical protein